MSVDNTNTEVLNWSIDDVELQNSSSFAWHTWSYTFAIRGVYMVKIKGLLVNSLFFLISG